MEAAGGGPQADATYDVVVVGSGFAGLAAGIESLVAGARVAVVDKRRHSGGNSRISDGVVAAAGIDEQRIAGIADSADLLFDDMVEAGLGRNDPAWARLVAEESGAAFRWLTDHIGCEFHRTVYHFGGHSRARCLEAVGGGKALVRALEAHYRDLGGELLLDRTVDGFVRGEEGRVVGAELAGAGKLSALRGVVVAAGGFAGDVELRCSLDDRLGPEVATTNIPRTTGELLQLVRDIGGDARDLEWIQLGPWTSPDERGYGLAPAFTSFTAFPYGIIVDSTSGKRYVNELGDRREQADAMLERDRPSIAIACTESVTLSGQSTDLGLRTGCVEAFDSLDDLAARHGTDAAELSRTVEQFNDAVRRGVDAAFDKPILDGCVELRPPFLAARLWPKTHFTVGGLVTDASTRVLDEAGAPIPGLYAAGEVTGGTHGACRLSSMAIPECIVQGRRAGHHAARAG